MRKRFIDRGHTQLSIRRQSRLVGVNRNRLAALDRTPSTEDLRICRVIDEVHLRLPFYGFRRMAKELQSRGSSVGRGRARRLMRQMGLVAAFPQPRTSKKAPGRKIYPYLLRDLEVVRPNQAWSADITYIPMGRGFVYLVAFMDWHSRAVLAWKISNTLDSDFCVAALQEAREVAGCWPEIMNTDQGCQFTSAAWTDVLREADVRISMDGRGRWIDNVFVERLWRSLKYEDIYLHEYLDLVHLETGVAKWMSFHNHERRHQSLDYETPWMVWQCEAQQAA